MRRRHTIHRKRYRCGHVGLGQRCHRCEQAKACRSGATIGTGVDERRRRDFTANDWNDEASRLERAS